MTPLLFISFSLTVLCAFVIHLSYLLWDCSQFRYPVPFFFSVLVHCARARTSHSARYTSVRVEGDGVAWGGGGCGVY